MTYMERITAADTPNAVADLIAAEAESVKWSLNERYGTLVWKHRSHAQARRNREHNENVLNALRAVWRLAHNGDPTWRTAVVEFIDRYEAVIGGGKLVRYRLIAEHAPTQSEVAA